MISVDEAHQIIQTHTKDFGVEQIPLEQAIGRVLRTPVAADRPFPPYDRITMDGIAISYSAYERGRKTFPIAGIAAAGDPLMELEDPESCLEAMTGAILPKGTDTIIRYEDLVIENNHAAIQPVDIREGQNVHRKGSDRDAGDVIISPGMLLGAAELGVCATVGKHHLEVSRLPRAIVISTGDELVDIHETPLPHQIRKSNTYRLKATLERFQIPVETAHLNDTYSVILQALKDYLDGYDLILLSGGVSKGKFDFLPKALDELGVVKRFHGIAQRPGKPFWFGNHPGGSTVFAFPGNPVSSFMCMQRYFIPWIQACIQQHPPAQAKAILSEAVTFKPSLTYFLQSKLRFDDAGKLLAVPTGGKGSGDLANLVDGDAFIELPPDREHFEAGEIFPVIPYRPIL